jgi:hypothetical protein
MPRFCLTGGGGVNEASGGVARRWPFAVSGASHRPERPAHVLGTPRPAGRWCSPQPPRARRSPSPRRERASPSSTARPSPAPTSTPRSPTRPCARPARPRAPRARTARAGRERAHRGASCSPPRPRSRGLKDVAALEAQLAASAPKRRRVRWPSSSTRRTKIASTASPTRRCASASSARSTQEAAAQVRERAARRAAGQEHAAVLIEPIRTPVDASGPSRGPANAPMTIVRVRRLRVPVLRARRGDTSKRSASKHPNKVRLVYQGLPLRLPRPRPCRPPSRPAARASRASSGRCTTRLFGGQRDLGESTLHPPRGRAEARRREVGKCQSDPAHAAAVRKDDRRRRGRGRRRHPGLLHQRGEA